MGDRDRFDEEAHGIVDPFALVVSMTADEMQTARRLAAAGARRLRRAHAEGYREGVGRAVAWLRAEADTSDGYDAGLLSTAAQCVEELPDDDGRSLADMLADARREGEEAMRAALAQRVRERAASWGRRPRGQERSYASEGLAIAVLIESTPGGSRG